MIVADFTYYIAFIDRNVVVVFFFCDISIPVSCPVCLPDYVLCCLDSVAVVESFPPADGPPATHTLNEVRT